MINGELIEYSVGKCYPQFKNQQDCYRLEYDNGGLWLYVLLRGWTAQERRAVRADQPIEFRFVEHNKVGFLCIKFEGMPWGDCPFHPALYREHGVAVEMQDFGKIGGVPLTIICADTATGEVLNLRLVGLGNAFSKEWLKWAAEQYDVPMPRSEYEQRIDEVYRRASSDALAAVAPCRWTLEV